MRIRDSRNATILLGSILGGVFAAYLYGVRVLDPRNIDWLRGESDPLFHFLGWAAYRRDMWRTPVGLNPQYGTLVKSSVVYTDSTPWLAITCKAVGTRLLGAHFQYVGALLLLNFAALGAAGAAIAFNITGGVVSSLLFSALVVSQPWTTMRGIGAHGHESLTATWLVWMATWFCGVRREGGDRFGTAVRWGALLLVCALTHLYLLVMTGAFWVVSCICSSTVTAGSTKWKGRPVAVEMIAVSGSLLGAMWAVGYGAPPSRKGGAGFGYYSAELLTFVNPGSSAWFLNTPHLRSLSRFWEGWKTPIPGQYEGQCYLGLGALGFTMIAACCYALARAGLVQPIVPGGSSSYRGKRFSFLIPTVTALVLFLFALGDTWVWGTLKLLHWPLPPLLKETMGGLRAHGRFSWPLACVLLTVSLAAISRTIRPAGVVFVLSGAVALQFVDLAPYHASVRGWARRQIPPWRELEDSTINQWFSRVARITILPPSAVERAKPFAWVAAMRGIPINSAHYVRLDYELLDSLAAEEIVAARAGNLDRSSLYVFPYPDLAEDACARPKVLCYKISDLVVAIQGSANEH